MHANRALIAFLLLVIPATLSLGCGSDDGASSATNEPVETGDTVDDDISTETDTLESTDAIADTGPVGPNINDCEKTVSNDYVCNPYCQLGCPEEQHCTTKANQIGCTVSGTKAQGDICSQSEECSPGLACFKLTNDIDQICRTFCIDDSSCPTGHKCDLSINFGGGQETFCGDVTVGCNAFKNPIADCAADCTSKECGSDGCGGSCGTCSAETTCSAGNLCVAECVTSCEDAVCGDDGCGGSCGECPWEDEVCTNGQCCEPDCTDKACGDDGCGGSCGECDEGLVCGDGNACAEPTCQPDCAGKTCGDNGCGELCGECNAGSTCEAGNCEEICVPECTDIECGDNGCGDSCGECEVGLACEAGTCVACTADCTGKICGDDGCGGSCGECEGDLSCVQGVACADVCVPDCEGITCGDNGCGGSCGECAEGNECDAGACVDACVPSCDGLNCGDDGCDGSCGECEGDTVCVAGQCAVVCIPSCDGKTCGDDGCGGPCGECAEAEICSGTFACIPACTPTCEGKSCGGDGCGESCGSCDEGSVCAGGSCVETPCVDGEACYLANGATKCMGAGSLGMDEACYGEAANACAPGLQCLVTCQPICSTTIDDKPQCAQVCANGQFTELSPENHVGVCFSPELPAACDIFNQTGCPPGKGCYMVNVNGVTAGVGCVSAGVLPAGEPCEFGNDCSPGNLCTNGICQEVCNAKEDAPPETSCAEKCVNVATFTPAEWGIGACVDAAPEITCNFWEQDCEDPEQQCIPFNTGSTCLNSSGEAPAGEACGNTQDCAGGLICSNSACIQPCSIAEFPENPETPVCIDTCPGGNFDPVDLTNQIGKCSE